MKKIYQIQIALKGVKPKIWRRVLVPSNILLSDLHEVIQVSMGWSNAHLHQFVKNEIYYGPPSVDDWDDYETEDYSMIKLSSFLKEEKDLFKYEYDFGDGWEHDIILEKILPVDENTKYPVCLTGKMSCPPEDCGGVWGYSDMLDILSQPKHPEYKSYIEWLGGEFDPKSFDKELVNALFLKYFS